LHKSSASKLNLKKALDTSGLLAAPISQLEFKLEKNLLTQNSSDEETPQTEMVTEKEAAQHSNVTSKLFELQIEKRSDDDD
jgi:hypothetical protein